MPPPLPSRTGKCPHTPCQMPSAMCRARHERLHAKCRQLYELYVPKRGPGQAPTGLRPRRQRPPSPTCTTTLLPISAWKAQASLSSMVWWAITDTRGWGGRGHRRDREAPYTSALLQAAPQADARRCRNSVIECLWLSTMALLISGAEAELYSVPGASARAGRLLDRLSFLDTAVPCVGYSRRARRGGIVVGGNALR